MPRYAITTFGCQMNVHDSERMHEVLRSAGYAEAEDVSAADVVLLNTCSVREKAEQKLLSEVGRLAKEKRARPDMLIVVAGCVAQQEGEKLLERQPAIDLVVGPDQIPEIPALLGELTTGGLPIVRTVFDAEAPRFLTAHGVLEGRVSAFVTTMKGCDERCSFCIVPTTRGPERYRESASILGEIQALASRGVREVTLLGQTVNSYEDPTGAVAPEVEGESAFPSLLRRIASEVPGLRRLRYTSPHPRHLTASLMRAHADLEVLARHVHLPVQSGSDRVLKRMIRRTTRAGYVARVNELRTLLAPRGGITLSTDIIVGFPGETEADFQETLSLVEEVGFVGVFGFKYSQRPFTPALKLEDDVTEAEKSDRLTRLFELSERLTAAHLERLRGSTLDVLVDGESQRREGTFTGRSAQNEIVHLHDEAARGLVGEVVPVRVEEVFKHSVRGALDEGARARGLAKKDDRPRGRRVLPIVASEAP